MNKNICIFLGAFFIALNCPASNRMSTPLLVGDSWSSDADDWPGFTSSIQYEEYRNHAISGEWLSVRSWENKWGMAANISDYLALNPDADSLIIQGGINDIFRDMPAARLKTALLDIITQAKATGHIDNIIVMAPGPFGSHSYWTPAKQSQLEDYLDWLPDFTAEQEVDFYNTYEAVNHLDQPEIISDGTGGQPDYDYDGLHVNLLGALKIATEMDQLIMEIRGRPVQIIIDIEPWDEQNVVYPFSDTAVWVALLGMAEVAGDDIDFDATQIDPASLRLGPGEAPVTLGPWVSEFNGDAYPDVLVSFSTQASGIFCNDSTVSLAGETFAGEAFTATGEIDASVCDLEGCH